MTAVWGRLKTGRLPLLICLAVLVVLWEVLSYLLVARDQVLAQSKLPFPHLILAAIFEHRGALLRSLGTTGLGAVIGLAVGTLTGLIIAIVLTRSRWAERSFSPYLVGSQMIPTLALGPILYAILRQEMLAKVCTGAYITFFAVAINTMKGLRSVSPSSLDLMDSYAARPWQVYWFLRFPSAAPFIFTGLKIAGPLSVVGAIVVELMGSKTGLGYIILATQYFGPSHIYMQWAAMLVTAALGLLFTAGASLAERWVTPWQPEFRGNNHNR